MPFSTSAEYTFSPRLVGEYLVHLNLLFKLAFWILVEAADPDIADTLTVQGCLLRARTPSGRNWMRC